VRTGIRLLALVSSPFFTPLTLCLNMSRTGVVTIALIDEHPLMRECLHNYLGEYGYSHILQATDGKELIGRLSNDRIPDICVLEFNARKKAGYETIKMLRATWPQIKIVIYSLKHGPVENKTQASGADAVIAHQSSLASLKHTLEGLVKPQPALTN
jgi:DNA-binding NarL/FixJ family response regulator